MAKSLGAGEQHFLLRAFSKESMRRVQAEKKEWDKRISFGLEAHSVEKGVKGEPHP